MLLLSIFLTLERPSVSIDAFEVFNFLYLHRILIFFPKTFGHFLYYCSVEFVCFFEGFTIKTTNLVIYLPRTTKRVN